MGDNRLSGLGQRSFLPSLSFFRAYSASGLDYTVGSLLSIDPLLF